MHGHAKTSLAGLGLAALGVVFGDIGTSPLYTLKTVLDLAGGKPDPATVLGILSLVLWTLMIITTIKYVTVAMSLDNDGEGGILAVMSLVGIKKHRPLIVAIGLFGAALIYGDGAVTPAISVLSALEGLNMVTPTFQPYVLPAAVVILVILFAAQPLGTERIGKAFGPIMLSWFLVMAFLGLMGILHHPAVFAAVNPLYGLHYLFAGGVTGFLVLGGVFLCVTGAEALYADMGHFGPTPIRISWLAIVFPSLILNYAGQAAIVLEGTPTDGNIFFRLAPGWALIPMIGLATLATIIASQSIITGAYSMTRQAIQLGWLPRLAIKQTSSEGYGQIYVGSVNWLLMIVTVALVLGFRKSDNLASAYGIAVSLTMLMTTVLLFIAMREIWNWNVAAAGAVAAVLLVVDLAFFSANLVKIADGGYVPLLLACAVYGVMWLWHHGMEAVQKRYAEDLMPIGDFTAHTVAQQTPRVPGTAVFLTRQDTDVPAVLIWHLLRNRALHRDLIVLTVSGAAVPWINADKRLEIKELAPRYWRARATFGFMERPDIPALIDRMKHHGCVAEMEDITYYVGHTTVTHRDDGQGLPRWQEVIYAMLERNSIHAGDFLLLPSEQTVELGRQIAI
ncbi:KUP/HAK/KT family potassium transporter [Hyphomicrobiales bacterium BP6-180914]|uniref:Probable potassium transport system protein Kup n=1 Tax=Lichenifustis flavocetrariae TaxID=2949735 RepID=A0AA41YZL7_9HYPH|nr:KUP/HAK/KT family potassium transporter [Lichenifustis flavocetrariae]MCW6510226.1 KUP/HAK/KT family potassium transporter [Lichenifustis flavocetrariae]